MIKWWYVDRNVGYIIFIVGLLILFTSIWTVLDFGCVIFFGFMSSFYQWLFCSTFIIIEAHIIFLLALYTFLKEVFFWVFRIKFLITNVLFAWCFLKLFILYIILLMKSFIWTILCLLISFKFSQWLTCIFSIYL